MKTRMQSAPTERDHAVGNGGERVTVDNTWLYWAHLSIYRFALPFCSGGRRVLDAGSGAGYGAAYLAQHGAAVLAFEADRDAVSYARDKYQSAGVSFEVADLNQALPTADRQLDVVFSSNVFEHVANVDGLAAECARAVKRDGVVIVAVPPVTWAGSAEADIRNHFHVQHIPPTAWHAKLSRFFAEVTCYIHHGRDSWHDHALMVAEHARPAHEVTIRETDFDFTCIPVEQFAIQASITALFVCRQPRDLALPESLAERMPAEWHTGAIVARIIQQERQVCEDRLRDAAMAQQRLTMMLASTSWRVTAPLRHLARALRRR